MSNNEYINAYLKKLREMHDRKVYEAFGLSDVNFSVDHDTLDAAAYAIHARMQKKKPEVKLNKDGIRIAADPILQYQCGKCKQWHNSDIVCHHLYTGSDEGFTYKR